MTGVCVPPREDELADMDLIFSARGNPDPVETVMDTSPFGILTVVRLSLGIFNARAGIGWHLATV